MGSAWNTSENLFLPVCVIFSRFSASSPPTSSPSVLILYWNESVAVVAFISESSSSHFRRPTVSFPPLPFPSPLPYVTENFVVPNISLAYFIHPSVSFPPRSSFFTTIFKCNFVVVACASHFVVLVFLFFLLFLSELFLLRLLLLLLLRLIRE